MGLNNLNLLSASLKNALEKPLPGEKAHATMAPIGRPLRDIALKKYPNPKKSAVLVLLFPDGEDIKTVLMERNAYKGVHSKQISFPGGKVEKQDISLQHTALREAEEEVGLNQNEVEVLGELTQLFIPPSGYLVNPFVGVAYKKPNFVPEQKEVSSLIFPSLKTLLNPNTKTEGTFGSGVSGFKITAPCYNIHNHLVWGATAMIISELTQIISNNIKYQ